MKAEELRALQAPVKAKYKENPQTARAVLKAQGTLRPQPLVCDVAGHQGASVAAGLHPMTGGDGQAACSGDMLLEALVGCAGVTLLAVATALDIPVRGGTVTAEGDLDFRGTLGVAKDADVGFTAVRLSFQVDSDATAEQLAKLVQLTERYCVVYQTLRKPPTCTASIVLGQRGK